MSRVKLNALIDVVAFAAMAMLFSTGLILQYLLPPGSGGLEGRGTGRGAAEQHVSLLWGWSRHEWGQVHYWIAGALAAILALHLALHWKWIVCTLRGVHGEASGRRFGIGVLSLIGLILLAMLPLLSPTRKITRGELRQSTDAAAATPAETKQTEESEELRGSMAVAEFAEKAGLSIPELLRKLGLPEDTLPDERMGRLLRQHNMTMNEARQKLKADTPNTP